MRINVYAEELTDDVQVVTKTVKDEKFGERTFHGVRLFLKSHPDLHSDPADDDRSAITFWVGTREQLGQLDVTCDGLADQVMVISEMLTQ